MRNLVLFLFLLVAYSSSFAQASFDQELFTQRLNNAQVVLLGEPDHYSTTEMLQKVAFIKELHSTYNYTWLAFESSLYDMHKANEDYLLGKEVREVLNSGIFSIWHRNEAIDSLESYLKTLKDRKSLQLTGFDSQLNSGVYTQKSFCQELESFLSSQSIPFKNDFFHSLQREIDAFDGDSYSLSEAFDKALLDEITTIINALGNIESKEADFWKQNLISIHGLFYDYYYNKIPSKVANQNFKSIDTNIRDSLMANNLLWFLDNHPNEKIIGWGASFHFANDLSQLSHPSDSTLSKTKTMGYYLKKALGNKVVIISFADLKRIENMEGDFIEKAELFNGQTVIKDFKLIDDNSYCSSVIGLNNDGMFPSGKWKNVVDYAITFNSESPIKREGTLIDEENGQPVPFAHIRVEGTNIGTITNEKGKFRLLIPAEKRSSKIEISCVGYQPLDIENEHLSGTIKLVPDVRFLKAVEVTGEREMPVDLLIKVANNFVQKSIKTDYQLDAYYYSWWTDFEQPADTAVNEAALKIIYKNGYEKNQAMSHTIINKRLVYGKKHLVPWPIHTLGMADFRPEYGLLNNNAAKYITVDSIKSIDDSSESLTTIYYSILKPSPKIVGSGANKYRAEITFSSNTLEVLKKSIFITFDGNNLQNAEYHIEYENYNGVQVPSFAWMSYDGFLENRHCMGKEAIRITNVISENIEQINNPVINLNDAPYSKEFWRNYNRIVD